MWGKGGKRNKKERRVREVGDRGQVGKRGGEERWGRGREVCKRGREER